MEDLRVDELATHVGPIFFPRRGRGAIKGDVSALRTDHQLVACRIPGGNQLLERGTDSALGSLAPIIDGSVDEVDAAGHGRLDGGFAGIVLVVGALAEVCPDAEG